MYFRVALPIELSIDRFSTSHYSKVALKDNDYWLKCVQKRAGPFPVLPLMKNGKEMPLQFNNIEAAAYLF
jgi:hypothetical protein